MIINKPDDSWIGIGFDPDCDKSKLRRKEISDVDRQEFRILRNETQHQERLLEPQNFYSRTWNGRKEKSGLFGNDLGGKEDLVGVNRAGGSRYGGEVDEKIKPTVLQPNKSMGIYEIGVHGHRNPKGIPSSNLGRERSGLIIRLKTKFTDK